MEPFASLAGAVRGSVPRLLINRDLVGPFAWRRRPQDVVQLGDVVSGVQALVDALGWTQELDALMAAGAQKVSVLVFLVLNSDYNSSTSEFPRAFWAEKCLKSTVQLRGTHLTHFTLHLIILFIVNKKNIS